MEDMLDFDLFLRETRREPLEVHVYGQSIPVPPAIPALVPVMMARSEHMQDSEAAALVVKAADALFSREKVDWMCDMGMSTEDLAELVQQTFRLIEGRKEDGAVVEDDAGRRRRRAGK